MRPWRLRVGPLVEGDLRSIEQYYREVAPEQVTRFRRELRNTMAAVRNSPLLGREHAPGVRRRATRVFPYHAWYVVDDDARTIIVTAVLHQRRDPALAALRTR